MPHLFFFVNKKASLRKLLVNFDNYSDMGYVVEEGGAISSLARGRHKV